MHVFKNVFILAASMSFLGVATAQVKHFVPSNPLVLDAKDNSKSDEKTGVKLDLDGDGTDDTYVTHWAYASFQIWNLNFNQFDDNNPKVEFHYNKNTPKSPIGSFYLQQMLPSQKVNEKTDWDSKYLLIGDIYNQNFVDRGEKYIGFRIITGTDKYKYGWLKMEATGTTDFTITIKEYAIQQTENAPIEIGQTTGGDPSGGGGGSVGIAALPTDITKAILFPNPSSGQVTLQFAHPLSDATVQVISLEGKVQYTTEFNGVSTTLDLSGLATGIYQVVTTNDQEQFVSRLVID